jgi:8-oxo-dGTP diphosphatase
MAIQAGWRFCARCASALTIGVGHASCTSCGSVYYANSAPAVGVIVERENADILLGLRAQQPDVGLWDTIGGFLDEGEHPHDAVRREVLEETGLEVEPQEFLGTYLDTYGTGDEASWVLNLVFAARIVSGTPVAADDVAELRWFPRDALPAAEECAFRWVSRFLRDLETTA